MVTALLTLNRIRRYWLPFFCMLLLSFFAEAFSFYFIGYLHKSNALVIKIYSLAECLLLTYQFYLWQNKRYLSFYAVLATLCLLFWIVENIVFKNLSNFVPYFRVFYAFIVVLLSVNLINSLMVSQRTLLLTNPVFVLCAAFIIFFTYQIIYEASYFVGAEKYVVANKIILLFAYVNAIVNMIYAVVIRLIPKHRVVS